MKFRRDYYDALGLWSALGTIRLLMAISLYTTIGIGDTHRAQFINAAMRLPYRWLYLVSTWDTVYYNAIANTWYPHNLAPVWFFFPLYPLTITAFSSIGIDSTVVAFVIALVAGLVSVPLFLRIANRYFSRDIAIATTLLYFLLPPVFLFSGVSYSEPLFLVLCLLTWDAHQTGHDIRAGLFSGLVTLTRINGVVIALPLAYDYLRRRQRSKLVFAVIAPLVMTGWVLYGYLWTGTWFPMLTAESYFTPVDPTIQENVVRLVTGHLTSLGPLLRFLPVVTAGLTFTMFTIFLSYRANKIDKALGLYAMMSIILVLVFGIFPAVRGFPRFFSFLFPIGLGLCTKRRWLFVITVAAFMLFDYLLWWGFLGGWVV